MCAPSSASGSDRVSAPAQILQVQSYKHDDWSSYPEVLKPAVWLLGSADDRMTRCARTELDVEQGRIVHLLHIT